MRFLLACTLILLAACGAEPPLTFAEPAAELERLQEATRGECRQERQDYWFCSAEEGFFHLFTVKPAGSSAWQVSQIMLEKGAEPDLESRMLSLYGFSRDDLAAIAIEQPLRRGGFELALDGTWKQPVVRVAAGE